MNLQRLGAIAATATMTLSIATFAGPPASATDPLNQIITSTEADQELTDAQELAWVSTMPTHEQANYWFAQPHARNLSTMTTPEANAYLDALPPATSDRVVAALGNPLFMQAVGVDAPCVPDLNYGTDLCRGHYTAEVAALGVVDPYIALEVDSGEGVGAGVDSEGQLIGSPAGSVGDSISGCRTKTKQFVGKVLRYIVVYRLNSQVYWCWNRTQARVYALSHSVFPSDVGALWSYEGTTVKDCPVRNSAYACLTVGKFVLTRGFLQQSYPRITQVLKPNGGYTAKVAGP